MTRPPFKTINNNLLTSGLVMACLLSLRVYAQDAITPEDYQRAAGFLYENYHNKKAFNLTIEPHWFPDSSGVWYIKYSPDQKQYYRITFPDLKQDDLFDHQKLAKILSDTLGRNIQAQNLPISTLDYKSHSEMILTIDNKKFILNTKQYSLTPYHEKPQDESVSFSPDQKWMAFTKDHNLYIKSMETNEVRQLSTSGVEGYEYATWYGWGETIEGEHGDRPAHFGVDWSENSAWISANIWDFRTARKMHLLDWSVDTLYRPKLLSYYRGSPGDTTMIYVEPVFFNVNSGKEIRLKLPKSTHINAVQVFWSKTPGKVYLQQLSRGFQNLHLYSFDLATERLEVLYTENSKTNIDNFSFELAEKSHLLFFLSEKSSWQQLYSLNLQTKKETPLTAGAYYIHGIEKIDETQQKIYFIASGREPGCNPYYRYLYSISFDGQALQLLTPEDRNHQINISPDGQYIFDNLSTVNIPNKTVLRQTKNGATLLELGQADVSRLPGWSPPEIFTALARDGKTTIYGAIWKPLNFDATKSYPVIEMSYTGPHTQVFPRNFSSAFSLQPYAELGFVAIVVDGLGSSGRSKEFHNYSYKNLGGNLEDHVGAIKQLGRRYNWIDTTRVGIFGHSAGGYDAGHALLAYPDFYKVGVASSADHDHRMEKAWWPEMYMGWPVDSAYHLQSNITMAGHLKGKLLITHGGIDENVNPSATFKLAEALIKADKSFDMLILPSQRHGYTGVHRKYFLKVQWNYFVRHLRGVEPIWDFKWD